MSEILEAFDLATDDTVAGVSIAGEWRQGSGGVVEIPNPTTGEVLARVSLAGPDDYEAAVSSSVEAFQRWRTLPAPRRGEYVRQIGNALRDRREELGALVSLEVGKILPEGIGEVQEMIDICDFAVGLSRQLYGKTMASERPNHRMLERWHPLGVVGIISAFNFPVAVWSWNAALALVCGNVCVWKPSEKTPLTAMVCQHLLSKVLERNELPEGISSLIQGRSEERRVGKVCRY